MGKRRKSSTSVAKKQYQSDSNLVLKLNEYYVARDYTSVVKIWNDSSLDSSDFECASIAAASYYFLEDYTNCNSILQDHSVSVFENPDVAALFGASLRLEGRFHDSESVFKQALSLHPDHPSLSNNYSNLLIQLDRLSEAHDILRNICESSPTYKDAHSNLHRVLALIEQKQPSSISSSPKQDVGASDSPPEFKYSLESLFNPSHDAFSLQELQLNSLTNTDQKAVKTLLAETTSSDPALLHQCIRFSRLTVESQPKLTLDDCNAVLDRFGLMPEIYELAAEAYLYLKQFQMPKQLFLLLTILVRVPPVF